jgi:hypothetical protein
VEEGGVEMLTVTESFAVAAPSVQEILKVVAEDRLPVDCDPEVALVPLQPPEAVLEVGLVELQLSVEAEPEVTVVGLAEMVAVTVGGGGGGGEGFDEPPYSSAPASQAELCERTSPSISREFKYAGFVQ